jgi:TusA-related sulfurtransferase
MPAPSVVLDLGTAEQECGDPALARVRSAYATLQPGAVVEAHSPIAEHAFAVRAWARREGAEVVGDEREGTQTVLRVRKPF